MKDGRSVHSASLVDLCHVKQSELAKHLQIYKERVVPREGTASRTRWIQSSAHGARKAS